MAASAKFVLVLVLALVLDVPAASTPAFQAAQNGSRTIARLRVVGRVSPLRAVVKQSERSKKLPGLSLLRAFVSRFGIMMPRAARRGRALPLRVVDALDFIR